MSEKKLPEKKNPKYGLLVDYEYCTGCHTCEVACKQEFHRLTGIGGIKVMEILQELPGGKLYPTFIPFPTELCVQCAHRVREGKKPACVQHCMTSCLTFGPIQELAKLQAKKPRTVLWAPK
jgi:Fe-S-cluster-containing dehydrogenase component